MARGLLLTVLLVAAVVVRVHHLGTESVWLDEAAAVQIAHDPPGDVVLDSAQDVHPPLYYLLLHAWIGRFGDSARAIRALSVLVSLLAVLAVTGCAWRWFGAETALLAAGLAALSPLQIAFAQETRMYALLTLTALWSVETLLGLLRAGTGRAVALFVLATTAMLYTHVYGWFVLTGELVWLAGLLAVSATDRPRRVRLAGLGFGLVAVLFLPWLPSFLVQLRGVERAFWIPPNATLAQALVAQAGSSVLLALVAPAAIWAVVGTWRQARHHADQGYWALAAVTLAAAVVLSVLGVPYLLSRVSSPIYLPKYTIAASLALLLLVARGLALLPSRLLRGAVVVAIVVGTVGPLDDYFGTPRKDNWRDVVATVEREAEPGDLVVVSQAFGLVAYGYYANRTDLVLLPFLDTWAGLTTRSLDVLSAVAVGPYDRVWMIESDPDEATLAMRRRLDGYRQAVEVTGGGVTGRLYIRPGTSHPAP